MKKDLSVILIAHNEETNIGKMIQGLMNSYDEEILEIVVVDDHSSDKTAFMVQELQRRYKKVMLVRKGPPCGVGRALKTGFSSVSEKADYILSMDSDFVQSIKEVALLMREIEKGYDGVIGSRFLSSTKTNTTRQTADSIASLKIRAEENQSSRWPLSKTTCRQPIPTTIRAKPQ